MKNFFHFVERDFIKKCWFVSSWGPWFLRGNAFTHGSGAGAFAFGYASGSVSEYGSFRKFTKIKSYTSYYVSKVFFNLRYQIPFRKKKYIDR